MSYSVSSFHLDFLPFIWQKSFSLFAYISYQSPRFCLCYCFSSLSAFWGQGTGCVTLFYTMASTILSRKAYMINYYFNWTFETSQISISEFSFWRWHSLLSRSTQLPIVILPCVCVESNRQTDRDRCKGGWGRSSIKSRTATWIGGRELEIKELFLLEKRTFLFLLRPSTDHCEKGGIKILNQNEPTDRGTAGPGGRIEKHVRVLSISGRRLWFGTWGRFPWRGHEAGRAKLGAAREPWGSEPAAAVPVLSRLHFITLQPSSFRPSSFMFAEGLPIMFY